MGDETVIDTQKKIERSKHALEMCKKYANKILNCELDVNSIEYRTISCGLYRDFVMYVFFRDEIFLNFGMTLCKKLIETYTKDYEKEGSDIAFEFKAKLETVYEFMLKANNEE